MYFGRRAKSIMSRLNEISEEVILRAMNGDTEAFTELYKAYYKRVYFMSAQFFRNSELAKDVVQEVFIKVYKQIENLKTPKAFSSWLHVITYHECQNKARRKKFKMYELSEDEKIEDFPNVNEVDVVGQVENERVKEIIMESLEKLSDPLKEVAILRFFEELKTQEIADILEVPRSTVSTRIIKIKKVLSSDLERKGVQRNFGIAILSPTLIHEVYGILSKKYSIDETAANEILQAILAGGSIATAGGIAIATKILLGGLTGAAIIGGVWMVNQEEEPKPDTQIEWISLPSIEPIEEETAKIKDITYDTTWTSSSVHINVETTNNNYDKILINDSETLDVIDNGNYIIKLLKEDDILDEREIIISNIDRNSPVATGEELGNDYLIYLKEDISGINKNSIEYYKNGMITDDYTYDEVSNTLTIENEKSSVHELYVSDNAGNLLTITLKVVE